MTSSISVQCGDKLIDYLHGVMNGEAVNGDKEIVEFALRYSKVECIQATYGRCEDSRVLQNDRKVHLESTLVSREVSCICL